MGGTKVIQVEWKDSNGGKNMITGYKKELEVFVESLEEQGVDVKVTAVKKEETKSDGSQETANRAGTDKDK